MDDRTPFRHLAAPSLAAICLILLPAAIAFAQVEVSATLDATDGWARPGAYVPVTLHITNRTGERLSEVRLSSGGPVDVVAPCAVGPGETARQVIPVYYAGGDLRLAAAFSDAAGRIIAQTLVAPPTVRPLPADAAVVAVPKDGPEPGPSAQESVRSAVGAPSVFLLRLAPEDFAQVLRCGMTDAVLPPQPAALVSPFPSAARDAVQPPAYRLFAVKTWSAEDLRRLWIWLGVFALAAAVAGVMVPRRRAFVAAGAIVATAAAATAFIWLFGGVEQATIREARVFYFSGLASAPTMEDLVMMQSRGGAVVRVPVSPATTLPLPILAASEDFFRPIAVLRCDESGVASFLESRERQCLIHVFGAPEAALGLPAATPSREQLAALAARADVVAAILVEESRATDVAGRTQSVDAWAVEWQASADPDLAFAGRSLKWWNQARRQGAGPLLLAWWHDPLPAAEAAKDNRVRLPALTVYAAP